MENTSILLIGCCFILVGIAISAFLVLKISKALTSTNDPNRPSESVLIPGLNIFNFTPLITSSLFILVGIFVIFYDF